jgi:hypothetical protein
MKFAWFNLLDAVLFAFLAAAAAARIRRSETNAEGIRRAPVMLVTLLVYCVLRTVALALIALDKVPNNEGFAQNSLNAAPGTFYAFFQTALVWRWVSTVSELTAVLQATSFGLGDFVRFSSLLLGIVQPILNVMAVADVDWLKFSSLTSNDWNLMVQLYSGILYIYNGLAFLALGLLLLRLWTASLTGDMHHQRLRILLIAVVFASVTFFRGLMLVLFLFTNSDQHVASLVQSSWGAPAVLLAEWWSIVLSIFVLPSLWMTRQGSETDSQRSRRESTAMLSRGVGSGGRRLSGSNLQQQQF